MGCRIGEKSHIDVTMAEAEKLTETTIRRARLGPKQEQDILWDTLVKGFGVRILPGGSKTFWFQYRPPGGRSVSSRMIRIGLWPTTSLNDARKIAKGYAGAVAKGEDPAAAKQEERRRAGAQLRALLAEDGPYERDRPAPAQADPRRKTRRRSTKGPRPERCRNHRRLERRRGRRSFGNLVRLLLLTGARRGEIAKLTRDRILSDRLVLPPLSTKTGERHEVPLTELMRAVIAAQPVTLSKLAFPAEKTDGVFSNWGKAVAALQHASGVAFTLHDAAPAAR
jgi:integrase